MKKSTYYLILALSILLCCQQNRKGANEAIIIDNKNISNYYAIDTIIEKIEMIKLETNKKSIVSNTPNNLLVGKSYIYWIEVGYEGRVTIFDRSNGDFITQLVPTGEGPKEFSYITDVSLTEGEILELFSSPQRKIMYFSADGKFLKEQKAAYNFDKRIHMKRGVTVNHYNGPSADYFGQEKDYRIFLQDSSQKIINYFIPFQYTSKTISGSVMNFSVYDKSVLLFEPFYSNIFEITPEMKFRTKYQVKFKVNNPEKSFIIEHIDISSRHKAAVVKDVPVLNLFFENNRYLIIKYFYIKNQARVMIFDKKRNTTIANTNALIYSKWSWPLVIPSNIDRESIVFSYTSDSFLELYDKFSQSNAFPKLKTIRESTRTHDNPILVILSIKEQ